MRKRMFTWTTLAVIASFSFSPLARADGSVDPVEAVEETSTEQTATEPTEVEAYSDLDEDDDENPTGTPVTQSENSVEKAKKRQFWKNVILACSAVVVAIISILVVSNNNGKSS